MPCFDSRESADREEARKRLDLATRLLCEVMRDGAVESPSMELQKWWAEHHKDDENGTPLKQMLGKLGLPMYRSHKTVSAARIEAVNATDQHPYTLSLDGGRIEAVSPDWIDKHEPQVGGYFVVYDDAYTSYSPAKAFEEGHTAVFEASP